MLAGDDGVAVLRGVGIGVDRVGDSRDPCWFGALDYGPPKVPADHTDVQFFEALVSDVTNEQVVALGLQAEPPRVPEADRPHPRIASAVQVGVPGRWGAVPVEMQDLSAHVVWVLRRRRVLQVVSRRQEERAIGREPDTAAMVEFALQVRGLEQERLVYQLIADAAEPGEAVPDLWPRRRVVDPDVTVLEEVGVDSDTVDATLALDADREPNDLNQLAVTQTPDVPLLAPEPHRALGIPGHGGWRRQAVGYQLLDEPGRQVGGGPRKRQSHHDDRDDQGTP